MSLAKIIYHFTKKTKVRPRHSIESTLKRITEIDLSDSSSYTRTLAICDGSDQEDDQDVRINAYK